MTTLKSFIKHSHINPKLIRAVVRQCGGWDSFKEMAVDVANHGADAGWSGFTYYTDTVAFTKRNKADILEMAKEMAESIGEGNMFDLIAGFNCLKILPEEAAEAIYNSKSDAKDTVYNALAWFALEEVSRSYVDYIED